MACRGSALYLGLKQGQCAHPCSSGSRLSTNLLGSVWLLGVLGWIPGSCGVRIDLAWESKNVCSVAGPEAKSLMGYPLPSFRKASIQTNKQTNKQNEAIFIFLEEATFSSWNVCANSLQARLLHLSKMIGMA